MEYHSGYLVLHTPGWLEIWRLASIPDPFPPSLAQIAKNSVPYPQPFQREIDRKAYEKYRSTYPKGHFVPHAAFPCPLNDDFNHNAFLNVLIKFDSSDEAYLYDIPSRNLIEKIRMSPDILQTSTGEITTLPSLGEPWTILLNDRHVFLSSKDTGFVRVLDRETGNCVLNMRDGDYGARSFRCWEVGKGDLRTKIVSRLVVVETAYPGPVGYVPQYSPSLLSSKKC